MYPENSKCYVGCYVSVFVIFIVARQSGNVVQTNISFNTVIVNFLVSDKRYVL